MLRAMLGFVLGPKGRLSSSYSKTQHLQLVDGASKRSCMLCLVFRPRLWWAFCFHWPYFASFTNEVSENLLRSELLGLERSAFVQRPIGLQPDVVDSCLACGCACRRAKASAAEEASDACNAMVAFYMTNLSSRFC